MTTPRRIATTLLLSAAVSGLLAPAAHAAPEPGLGLFSPTVYELTFALESNSTFGMTHILPKPVVSLTQLPDV
ncbi:hypothetical protein [Sinosporangium siamense]|nr:hypothetical protein [Sinosporangium siamense]